MNVNYGAAQTDFARADVLDVLESVQLAKTDGGVPIMTVGDSLWKLMRRTPRHLAGTDAQGYTDVAMFLLEGITRAAGGDMGGLMGMSEGASVYHYADLKPTGITAPGLVLKPDRAMMWLWGDSFALEYIPPDKPANQLEIVR